MRLPPYPGYKPSGVEWLGDVPEHWRVERVKYCASINDEVLLETTDPEFEFQYVDIGSVNAAEGITRTEPLIFENAPSRARRKVKPGDTIVSTVRTYLRAIAPVSDAEPPLIVSTGFAVVRPRRIRPDYLSYALRESSFIETVVARSVGVSYPAVNASEIGNIRIPVPAQDEQTQIAAFLDRETGRIDALIEKKQRLIELLKEKRQAVITQAVTKGLDPNVSMKDSGVEWLGEVPEHWVCRSLGTLANVVRGASPRPAGDPQYFDGDFLPWVTVAEITKDDRMYLDETASYMTQEGTLHSRVFRAGTLLYSNSGATLGVPKITNIDACANDGVVGFESLSAEVDIRFLYYFLSSLTTDLRERIKQGAGQPNLNTEIVRGLKVALPPIGEQQELITSVELHLARFSILMEKATRSVHLLMEHRSALITAAVTGQIDVRDAA